MQKFRPILFSTPMVQAILQGRKTMTRRTKGLEEFNNPDFKWRYDGLSEEGDYYMELLHENGKPIEMYKEIFPIYNIGDILWVRETFFDAINFQDATLFKEKSTIIYKADEAFIGCHNWKPSIFMPKSACRIFLKVTNVRVERIFDISIEDAKSEGVCFKNSEATIDYKNYLKNPKEFSSFNDYIFSNNPQKSFFSLWESIYGKESIETNPYVFVYEFERIEKPLKFI